MKTHPYVVWGIVAALLTAGVLFVLVLYLDVSLGLLYLAGMNLVTFVLYKVDKLLSVRPQAPRIPNLVLIALAFLGGSVGALLGIYVGREGHKTGERYRLFRVAVWLSLVVLIALLVFLSLRPSG